MTYLVRKQSFGLFRLLLKRKFVPKTIKSRINFVHYSPYMLIALELPLWHKLIVKQISNMINSVFLFVVIISAKLHSWVIMMPKPKYIAENRGKLLTKCNHNHSILIENAVEMRLIIIEILWSKKSQLSCKKHNIEIISVREA